MPKPTKNAMPDLSELNGRLIPPLKLSFVFGGGPTDQQARQYTILFIRLTNKAIFEYEASRATLDEYLASNNKTLLMFQSVDHIETCVHSIKRALRFLDQMNRYSRGPDIPRETRRLFSSYDRDVTVIRDAIEHMDEYMERGEITPGTPSALFVNEAGDVAEIAGHTITFERLAMLLRRMHELAIRLLA
jgi:hypothetical protein